MGHRPHPIEVIRTQGVIDFAFLVSDEGFTGPEPVPRGVLYRRGGLEVELFFSDHCGRDLYVLTILRASDPELDRRRSSSGLDDVYVAHGLGPAQDVPGTAQTPHVTKKSLGLQAKALRRLIAFLKEKNPQWAQDRPVSWFQS